MKRILVFVFICFLSAQVCLGQKVFKITEGELQFIHAREGIFIKKDNTIYHLKPEDIDNYEKLSSGFKYELSNTTLEEIEKLKKDSSTVLGADVVKFDFKELDTQKFTTKNDINQDDNYRLYKYNKNFFVVSVLEDSIQRPRNEYLFHYAVLDFGNNKKIIYHAEGFIVPTKEKIRFLFKKGDLNDSFNNYKTTVHEDLQAIDIQLVNNSDLRLNGHFYKIDTLNSKQLQIKNLYNEKVIKQSFDSISTNGNFIVGYKKGKIEIYNYTFKKFNLKNCRAFSFGGFYTNMQIIDGESLRRINLIGENYKKEDLSYIMSGAHYFEPVLFNFKIKKKEDCFFLETNNINLLTHNYLGNSRIFKFRDCNDFETVEFLDEDLAAFTIDSEMFGFTIKDPIIIYTKLKNGKFNLNSLEYLLAVQPTKEIEDFNNTLPKDLDSISSEMQQMYRIEKNGLFTYYPIIKEIKYKILGEFQGNFARFELPNGQKGWLDLKGKEYLDQKN